MKNLSYLISLAFLFLVACSNYEQINPFNKNSDQLGVKEGISQAGKINVTGGLILKSMIVGAYDVGLRFHGVYPPNGSFQVSTVSLDSSVPSGLKITSAAVTSESGSGPWNFGIISSDGRTATLNWAAAYPDNTIYTDLRMTIGNVSPPTYYLVKLNMYAQTPSVFIASTEVLTTPSGASVYFTPSSGSVATLYNIQVGNAPATINYTISRSVSQSGGYSVTSIKYKIGAGSWQSFGSSFSAPKNSTVYFSANYGGGSHGYYELQTPNQLLTGGGGPTSLQSGGYTVTGNKTIYFRAYPDNI